MSLNAKDAIIWWFDEVVKMMIKSCSYGLKHTILHIGSLIYIYGKVDLWHLASTLALALDFGRSPVILYLFNQNHNWKVGVHSLIRGVLRQSCSAGAQTFTKYVF